MVDDEIPPNHHSVVIMAHLDAMPKCWRELVHEYGFVRVWAFRDTGMSFDDADFNCEVTQVNRQNEWLATDYHPGSRFTEKMEAENELRRRAAGIKKG